MTFRRLSKELKRILAVTLAVAMVATSGQVAAFADTTDGTAPAAEMAKAAPIGQTEEQQTETENASDETGEEASAAEKDAAANAPDSALQEEADDDETEVVESQVSDEVTPDEEKPEEAAEAEEEITSETEAEEEIAVETEADDVTEEEEIAVETAEDFTYTFATKATFKKLDEEGNAVSIDGGTETEKSIEINMGYSFDPTGGNNTAKLTSISYKGDVTDDTTDVWITVPGTITYKADENANPKIYTVTEINNTGGVSSIRDRKIHLTIEKGITNIGRSAFEFNDKAQAKVVELTFANDSNLITIERSAFKGAPLANHVILPNTVTSVGVSAFEDCVELKEITLSDQLVELSEALFKGCIKLEQVHYGNTPMTSKIGKSAFQNCTALIADDKYSPIPDAVTEIGEAAFKNCSSIKKITIPEGVFVISEESFANCVGSGCPEGCEKEECAEDASNPTPCTRNCVGLAEVVWEKEENIKEIQASAFSGDTNLVTINALPNHLESVGDAAFANTAIKTIFVPETLKYTPTMQGDEDQGTRPFAGCSEVTKIIFGKGVPKVIDHLFEDTEFDIDAGGTGLRFVTADNENLTVIGEAAFKNSKISKVDGPGITEIEAEAFASTPIVNTYIGESYTFPECVTLGNGAFQSCEKLQNAGFPKCTEIGDDAFKMGTEIYNDAETKVRKSMASTELTALKFPLCKKIGKNAFENCAKLTSVTFEICEMIGAGAFQNCYQQSGKRKIDNDTTEEINETGLKTVNFPECVEIGSSAFASDRLLQNIQFPKTQIIRSKAFSGCGSLAGTVEFVKTYKIEEKAFENCIGMTNFTMKGEVPQNAEQEDADAIIGDAAFSGCEKLQSFVAPTTLSKIGASAFKGCFALDSFKAVADIENPKVVSGYAYFVSMQGLKEIGERAFNDCRQIAQLDFGDGLKKIGDSAFEGSTRLSVLHFASDKSETPEKVTLGKWVFKDCTNLHRVEFSKNVQAIGVSAFYGCERLMRVKFAEGLETIGNEAFAGCQRLEGESELDNEETYTDSGSVEYLPDNDAILKIPTSVTSIGNGAFSGCWMADIEHNGKTYKFGIKKVHFAERSSDMNRVTVGERAFSECKNLEEIVCGNYVSQIQDSAYKNCVSLKELTIVGATVVGKDAFKDCEGIIRADIDAQKIKEGAFSGCGKLKEVVLHGVEEIGANAFNGTKVETVVIPRTLTSVGVSSGKGPFAGAQLKSVSGNDIEGATGVLLVDAFSVIPDNMFAGCETLTHVTIPATVTTIGKSAFKDAKNVQSLIFRIREEENGNSYGTVTINANAFDGCAALPEVKLPKTLTTLGAAAFQNCTNLVQADMGEVSFTNNSSWGTSVFQGDAALADVTLPTSSQVSKIAQETFKNCTALTGASLVIPANITEIGDRVFYGAGLTEMTIPNHVTTVGQNAFEGCSKLSKVRFSNKITKISANTFKDCTALEEIRIPVNVTDIGFNAFNGTGLKDVYFYGTDFKINSAVMSTSTIVGLRNMLGLFERSRETDGNRTRHYFNKGFTIHGQKGSRIQTIYYDQFKGSGYKNIQIGNDIIDVYSENSSQGSVPCMLWEDLGDAAATKIVIDGVTDHKMEMLTGKSVSLSATVFTIENSGDEQENHSTDVITWESSDANVASVNATGTVTAKKAGTATITATAGGVSDSCEIVVSQAINGIVFTDANTNKAITSITLEGGETAVVTVMVKVGNDVADPEKYRIYVENRAVFTYDEKTHVLKALKKGSSKLVVAATDGSGFRKELTVNVTTTVHEVSDPNYFESGRYGADANEAWIYTAEDVLSLEVTFDAISQLGVGDYVYIYDSANRLYGADGKTYTENEAAGLSEQNKKNAGYSGEGLAGKTIAIDGSSIRIQLISDANGEAAGFKVSKLVAVNKIIYNLYGGNLPEDAVESFRSDITEPITLKTPEKDHAEFLGWYTDSNFTDKVTQIPVSAGVGGIKLYANWQNEPRITYMNCGSDVQNPNAEYMTYDSSEVYTLQPASKENAKFYGWFEDAQFTTEITEIPAHLTEDMSVYACWKNDLYVVYMDDGSYYGRVDRVPYDNAKEFALGTPVREGYSFGGWYLDSAYTKPITSIPAGTTEPEMIYVYAKWTQIETQTQPTPPGKTPAQNTAAPTKDPGASQTGKPAAAGTTLPAKEAGAVYKVVSADEKAPTVVYTAPGDAKATDITIPDTVTVGGVTYKVTKIADNAFKSNKTIKKVKIGAGIETIGKNAFSGCAKLASVTIGKNVAVIDNSAFANCKALKKVTIPANVTTIGKKAFNKCSALKTVTIKSKKLKKVGSSAFKGIKKKATIKVPKASKKNYQKMLKKKVDKTTKIK